MVLACTYTLHPPAGRPHGPAWFQTKTGVCHHRCGTIHTPTACRGWPRTNKKELTKPTSCIISPGSWFSFVTAEAFCGRVKTQADPLWFHLVGRKWDVCTISMLHFFFGAVLSDWCHKTATNHSLRAGFSHDGSVMYIYIYGIFRSIYQIELPEESSISKLMVWRSNIPYTWMDPTILPYMRPSYNSSSVFFRSTHMLQVIGREMLTTMFWSTTFASQNIVQNKRWRLWGFAIHHPSLGWFLVL